MQIRYLDGKFVCRSLYEEREILRRAGFKWSTLNRLWYTDNINIAARLENFFDNDAKKAFEKSNRLRVRTWTKPLCIPKGESLLPFQKDAVLFALARNKSYLALDPGLGKTPISAVIAATLNAESSEHPIVGVYICPPFLTRNTENEFKRWAPEIKVSRYDKKVPSSWFTIIPDSILTREATQRDIAKITEITETARGHNVSTILFVDEAHRFKNDSAGRTKALFGKQSKPGIADLFDRVVYLSGTPMPNRPIELFPVLNHSAPSVIDNMDKFSFALKYCAAYQNQFGWDFTGASNVGELVEKVHDTFMLRYRKSEVLTELPPKTEEMVILNDELPPYLGALSRDILSILDAEDLMKGRLSAELGKEDLHLATYRRELGMAKIEMATDFIRDVLEETEDNILIFAIHKDVIAMLAYALKVYTPLVITGETPMAKRHEIVKEFQNDVTKRVFIGNIQAAGTGLTLTKATRVIFVEFSWVPSDNDQASDRAHRIGQTDNVFVQYLVYENSVDKAVIETILRKKKTTEQI